LAEQECDFSFANRKIRRGRKTKKDFSAKNEYEKIFIHRIFGIKKSRRKVPPAFY